jgi:Rod binding domain-containing protein
MAINPPTDIIQDVINAADPAQVEVAQAKLKAGIAVAEARKLNSSDAGFDSNIIRDHIRTTANRSVNDKEIPEPYRKFEAMVLQNFIKTMLPDSEEVYGKGSSGEIWKSMMAEQMGNEMSKGRGIGIAEQLASRQAQRTPEVEKAELSERQSMTTQSIQRFELKALDELLPGSFGEDDKKKRV